MSQKIERVTVAGVESIFVRGKEDAPYIVMLHGYGANCDDLFPLCQELSLSSNINWVFPNGVLEVILGPGYFGRAWFEIDMQALEQAMRSGTYRDFSNVKPKGMNSAVEKLKKFFTAINLPMEKTIMAGFSQGAMMAAELAFTSPVMPLGLVLLSGTLVDKENLKKIASTKKGLTFFQSHGSHDPMLSPDKAKELEELLTGCGLDGSLFEFRGGHEIPAKVLQQLNSYLKARLNSK
jgi:phospholipase/carboxylesterase